MWEKFSKIWKDEELRKRILFVLGLLVIFRLAAHIPIPGIDAENLKRFLKSEKKAGSFREHYQGGMSFMSLPSNKVIWTLREVIGPSSYMLL